MKDYFNYQSKNVVVTGAASGMGKAAAEMLVDLGAKVYALDWAEVTIDGIEKYIHTDLSSKDSIDEAFSQLPEHIDSFFGIAGVSGTKHDSLTVLTINFIANKYISEQYLVHRMSEGGSIAYMTSTGGISWKLEGNKNVYLPYVNAESFEDAQNAVKNSIMAHLPGALAYPCSKMAMNYYVAKAQALFTPKGIRVNGIMPGSTDSGMKDEFLAMNGGSMDAFLKGTGAIKRLATPEEMAEPIVFINSDMARFISGELMVIDYGHAIVDDAGLSENATPLDLGLVIQGIMARQQ